jgi:hypothetical protein
MLSIHWRQNEGAGLAIEDIGSPQPGYFRYINRFATLLEDETLLANPARCC